MIDTPSPSVAEIQAAVSAHYGLDLIEMRSARRSHAVSHPRQLAMFLSRSLTSRSLPEIGRLFGGRDHTTVIHAVGRVEARICADVDAAADAVSIIYDLAGIVAKRAVAAPMVEAA